MPRSTIDVILTLNFIVLAAIIVGFMISRLRQNRLKASLSEIFNNIPVSGPQTINSFEIDAGETKSSLFDTFISRFAPLILCTGLALMPFYHHFFVYVTSYVLVAIAALLSIYRRDISFGPVWVWGPLTIITISALIFSTPPDGLLMVLLFCIYIVTSRYGYRVTLIFGLVTAVYCLGVIGWSITHNFMRTSGIIAPKNVNIANAAILATYLLWDSKYKWLLSGLVIVGLFFTGSDEAFAAVLMLGAVILIRRDWSKKILLPLGALALTLIICTPLGITNKIWGHIGGRIDAAGISLLSPTGQEINTALDNRWPAYVHAAENLQLTGHGYQPFNDGYTTIHDVPLRAGYELGILSGVAWLIAFFYALIKSKAKYALVAIGVICLFDHLFWTQIPAFYWAGVGIALSAPLPDYIFKKVC